MQAYTDYIGWVLAAVAIYYLGLPLLIYFQQRLEAHPQFTKLDFHQLSPATAEFLLERTKALLDVGFDEPTVVRMPNPLPNLTTNLIMLVNRATGDKAMVTSIFAEPAAAALKTLYVEFSTRFASGDVFNTLNSSELNAFPPSPNTVRTQAPRVTDTQQLFRLHQFVMNKYGAGGGKIVYDPEQSLDYLANTVLIESYEKQVKRGWLYYDDGADVYRPTILGAYLMTWGLLQPFKTVRKMLVRLRERRLLAEFEQATVS